MKIASSSTYSLFAYQQHTVRYTSLFPAAGLMEQFVNGVKAGQFVTTGTCIVPMAIAPGDRIEIDYGELGKIGTPGAAPA